MYGTNPGSVLPAAIAPVIGLGAGQLPQTGATSINSIAISVAAGLVAWTVMHFVMTKKSN